MGVVENINELSTMGRPPAIIRRGIFQDSVNFEISGAYLAPARSRKAKRVFEIARIQISSDFSNSSISVDPERLKRHFGNATFWISLRL